MKPSVFIASSVEGVDVAYAVQKNLKFDAEVTVWNQGTFNPSSYTLEDLIDMADKSDFGIFVLSADDINILRNLEKVSVRDNVLFEMGLFIGKIGRKRVFSIKPNDTELHIASDLLGVNILDYENNRSDKNLEAGTGTACNDIRVVIKREGLIEKNQEPLSPTEQSEEEKDNKEKFKEELYKCYENRDYSKCVDIIDSLISCEEDESSEKYNKMRMKAHMVFKINNKKGELEYDNLYEIMNDEERLKTIVYRANMYLWEKFYKKCLEYIEESIETIKSFENGDEFTNELKLIKTNCLMDMKKIDKAKQYLAQEIMNNDSIKLKLRYFDILTEFDDNMSAEEKHNYIKTMYTDNPQNEQVIFKYAYYAQYSIKNYNIALYLWEKLNEINIENPEYIVHLGNTFLSLEMNNYAMFSYKKASELENEKASWILANIGNLYNNIGLYYSARKYLQKSLDINENYEYALSRLADIAKKEISEKEKKKNYLDLGRAEIYINV